MKIKILLLFSICIVGVSHAQIGINTENPQGMLHVKGSVNDVVVEEVTGNVGIGTLTPAAKLHVVGDAKSTGLVSNNIDVEGNTLVEGETGLGVANPTIKMEIVGTSANSLRIEGNTNYSKYVLTSNSDGVGSWNYLRPNTSRINGVIQGGNGSVTGTNPSIRLNETNNAYKKISTTDLTLGKGKWLIMVKGILYRASTAASHFVEMSLREGATDLYEVGVVPRYATGEPKIAIPQITAIVHIPDNTSRTYSVYAKATNNAFYTYSEGDYGTPYFYAIKLDDQ